MLKFRVEGQKLTWENPDEVVVAGTKKYLECYFEFDGDAWSGFEYIEAFFKNGRDKPIRMLLSANRIWKEDGLCLAAGDWSVYLRAVVSKKKVDEEGNVVYEEDGVTPVMELEKQMTSSSISIRVLAHGQFENAQNSFDSPEIAEQYIEQMLDIGNAMSVFEEYNPNKKYVKGNKVAYEGSSYVLTADEALGTNPTDTGSWLCIAEKGDKGEQGQQGIKGDKGASGGKIFSYALGYGKDVEVGSYKMAIPPFELIENGIDYNDIIVDTDGGCIFQYVASIGDDEAMLPAEGLHCIANPNGEKGDKGDKGERGIQGVQGVKGKDGFLGNEYKGEYSDDILYGDSDTVAFNSYTKANIGDYIIANPSVMTQFGNTISLWMCTECEDIYGNGNEYKLTFKRKFSYGNALPAVGENTQKRVLVTEGGGQPKWEDFPDGSASGAMVFKGVVSELPETANEGEVYKLVNEYYSVPINATDIVDDGNMLVFRTDKTSAFYKFISFTRDCMYGDSDITNFQTVDAYYYPNGKKTSFPWIYSTWHDNEGTIAMPSDETFYKALINGGNMEFSYSDTTYLPDDLKSYSSEIIKTYVYHNGEWVEISKDGVTKSEMESYIEETLLGGKW